MTEISRYWRFMITDTAASVLWTDELRREMRHWTDRGTLELLLAFIDEGYLRRTVQLVEHNGGDKVYEVALTITDKP